MIFHNFIVGHDLKCQPNHDDNRIFILNHHFFPNFNNELFSNREKNNIVYIVNFFYYCTPTLNKNYNTNKEKKGNEN